MEIMLQDFKVEKDNYIFLIPCPFCRNNKYEVKILVTLPKRIRQIRVYCYYKHSFLVSIKEVTKKGLLLETLSAETTKGGDTHYEH
jgi:hypothetical protein